MSVLTIPEGNSRTGSQSNNCCMPAVGLVTLMTTLTRAIPEEDMRDGVKLGKVDAEVQHPAKTELKAKTLILCGKSFSFPSFLSTHKLQSERNHLVRGQITAS